MTVDEIRRWFRRFKYDPEFRENRDLHGTRQVPYRRFCEFVGITYKDLHNLLADKMESSPRTIQCITYGIKCVEEGLRWRRYGRKTFVGGSKYEVVGKFKQLPRFAYHQKSRRSKDPLRARFEEYADDDR
jgi:hypothetical protein